MSQRVERVEKLARQVLGEEIQKLKDPRVGFATVTRVRLSADLRRGRVFISVLGSDDEQQATLGGLKSATSHLRAELGRQVRLKYLPQLHFELDKGPETAERLEYLFRRLETDSAGDAPRADGPREEEQA